MILSSRPIRYVVCGRSGSNTRSHVLDRDLARARPRPVTHALMEDPGQRVPFVVGRRHGALIAIANHHVALYDVTDLDQLPPAPATHHTLAFRRPTRGSSTVDPHASSSSAVQTIGQYGRSRAEQRRVWQIGEPDPHCGGRPFPHGAEKSCAQVLTAGGDIAVHDEVLRPE